MKTIAPEPVPAAVDVPNPARPVAASMYNGRTYAVVILTAVFTVNYLDRNVLNILIESIKAEMHLSDGLLGALAGFGFVLLYSGLGVPFARLADRTGRRTIISGGLFLWSLATAASGLARNSAMLGVARLCVGIGEAAGQTPSIALVSDYFPTASRPRAMGFLTIGTFLGIFLGLAVGGYVNQYYGWRAAFFVAGVPGLILAFLLRFTVKDPRETGLVSAAEVPPPMGQSLRTLFSSKTFVTVGIAGAFLYFNLYGFTVWAPSFFRRVYHLSSSQTGLDLGILSGLVGIVGAVTGGLIAERLCRRDKRWFMGCQAIACIGAAPAQIVCLLSHSLPVAFVAYAIGQYFITFYFGAGWATVTAVTTARTRAFGFSLHTLWTGLVGLGIGATVIGMVTDRLTAAHGTDAIRYSLLMPAIGLFAGAVVYLIGTRFVTADIERASAGDAVTA